MRAFVRTLFVFFLIFASGSGGYFAATRYRPQMEALAARITDDTKAAPAADGPRILYYRNPMGSARYIAGPEEGFDGDGLYPRL